MRMITRSLAGRTLSLLLLFNGSANASTDEISYSADYPGLKQRGGAVDLADSQVRNGILGFQMVFGRNPGSCEEVRAAGIFDNELRGYHMESIDPDDASADFQGDLYLVTNEIAGSGLSLLNYWNSELPDNGQFAQSLGHSYAQRLKSMQAEEGLSGEQGRIIDAWLSDTAQLTQFAHVRQLSEAVLMYQSVYGKYPEKLTDMISTGIGPLKPGSVNPMTGQPYRYDGSRGDILYENFDQGKGFRVSHVDLNFDTDFAVRY